MYKIKILGIDKAILLLYLYNYAIVNKKKSISPQALKMLVALNGHGSLEQAQHLIYTQMNFERVDLGAGSRNLKVNLEGVELDTTQYDGLYGQGHAARALYAAKQACLDLLNPSILRRSILMSPIVFTKKPASIRTPSLKETDFKTGLKAHL